MKSGLSAFFVFCCLASSIKAFALCEILDSNGKVVSKVTSQGKVGEPAGANGSYVVTMLVDDADILYVSTYDGRKVLYDAGRTSPDGMVYDYDGHLMGRVTESGVIENRWGSAVGSTRNCENVDPDLRYQIIAGAAWRTLLFVAGQTHVKQSSFWLCNGNWCVW